MLRPYKDNFSKCRFFLCHKSPITSRQSLFSAKRNFRRLLVHRSAALIARRQASIARSGTPRPRTRRATGGDKQCLFSATRGAPASPHSKRDPHGRIADDGGATRNHYRRSMVQARGGNAKTFPRSSGIAASNAGNCRPLQLATRTGKTHLSRMRRSGGRNAGFLFRKSQLRWRAETLSLSNTRSAFAVDARVSSHQEKKPVALFPARIGHRGGSAAARHSRGGTRVSGKFDGDVLPGNFTRVSAALGTVL